MRLNRAVLRRSSSAMTKTSVKNVSTARTQAGDLGEGFLVIVLSGSLFHAWTAGVEFRQQRLFGRFDQRRTVERRAARDVLGNILDALEQDRQRLEVFRSTRGLQRLGHAPGSQWTQLTAGRRGARHLAWNPALLERVADPLERERLRRPCEIAGPRRAGDSGGGLGQQAVERDLAVDAGQLRQIHQNSDRTLYLAAQRERIA